MSQSGERKELSEEGAAVLMTLIGANLRTPTTSEQDYLQAADELEADPPPHLTPEQVSLLVKILRN